MNPQFEEKVSAARQEITRSESITPTHKDVLHSLLDDACVSANGTPDKLAAIARTVSTLALHSVRHEVRSAKDLDEVIDKAIGRALEAHSMTCPYAKSLLGPKSFQDFIRKMAASSPVTLVIVFLWILSKFGPDAVVAVFKAFGGFQ